jgi:hypothetical protein
MPKHLPADAEAFARQFITLSRGLPPSVDRFGRHAPITAGYPVLAVSSAWKTR